MSGKLEALLPPETWTYSGTEPYRMEAAASDAVYTVLIAGLAAMWAMR